MAKKCFILHRTVNRCGQTLQLLRENNIGRHQVNQFAKRPDPDTLFDKEFLQLGLGETVKDRAGLLLQLANLPTPPESVPINMLVKVKGTPLADNDDVDAFDFIRTIAVARIMMPTSYVRLSAGREQMNEQTQAMCFMAGANSIFYGCKLLTTPNPEEDKDLQLFRKLGLNPQQTAVLAGDNEQQQRLEQALMTPDTDEYYNAAAL